MEQSRPKEGGRLRTAEKVTSENNEVVPDQPHRTVAYSPRPVFPASTENRKSNRRRFLWILVAAAALVFPAVEVPVWLRSQNQANFSLSAEDVDQEATARAKAALLSDQIPQDMADLPPDTRQHIKDGTESLYTKQVLPDDSEPGVRVHVTISSGGMMIRDEVLTPQHPSISLFPAGRGVPVHLHLLVEQAGQSGTVTCSMRSHRFGLIHTRPLRQGESEDLEATAQ